MTTNQQVYIEDINEVADEDMIQLVGFKLGDEEYAIDVLKIQEIIRVVEITSVPRMDAFVLGVMNLRGKVIPVIDLRVRFNLFKSDFDKRTRIIVVKFEKENIGFVVDEVTEVARISKAMVEPTPPLVGSIGQEYILGICKYDERLIILLDIDRVVYEGDNYTESELRKRFYKSEESSKPSPAMVEHEEPEPVIENKVESESVEAKIETEIEQVEQTEVKEEPESVADSIHDMVADAIEEDDGKDELDDIDALIAMELAKREKETEELLKKKKESNKQDNTKEAIDDILEDALNQAETTISKDAEHIDQDDLDALIAKELAMREQETEELLARKKAEEEKKKTEVSHEEVSENDSVIETEKNVVDVKQEKNDDFVVKRDSIEELKALAKKIIEGESVDLSSDIKSEIGDLLRLIVNTKTKLDDIDPNIEESKTKIPILTETLEDVNKMTEEAAFNLMEAADRMSGFYVDLHDSLENLESAINAGDVDKCKEKLSEIESEIEKADELGFRILQELEFQDITEQQLRKTINYIQEIGARLGTIMGFVKLQQIAETETDEASQEEIDKLLSDFGL